MRAARVTCRLGVIACLAVLLAGCYPLDQSAPEDNHPLIKAAEARRSSNPHEAGRLLEKALAENPRLARAHWELALISLNSTTNYAAAVYHFQKVLELRPDWPHASTARQLIGKAKIEMVKEGVEAPTLPSVQRQMDRLVSELHRLTEQNTNLTASVQYLTGLTQQLAAENLDLRQRLLALNQPAPPPGAGPGDAPLPTPGPGRTGSRPASAPAAPRPVASPAVSFATRPGETLPGRMPSGSWPRTYTVQRGETAFAISRRHGLTVPDLVAANPGLNPGRLKAGQRLNLPAR